MAVRRRAATGGDHQSHTNGPLCAEIEATYLVPSGSPLKTIVDVDSIGVQIAVTARSAYGLWLDRNNDIRPVAFL
jgi:hypothetical protein